MYMHTVHYILSSTSHTKQFQPEYQLPMFTIMFLTKSSGRLNIYWSDRNTDRIMQSNHDGSMSSTILNQQLLCNPGIYDLVCMPGFKFQASQSSTAVMINLWHVFKILRHACLSIYYIYILIHAQLTYQWTGSVISYIILIIAIFTLE